MNKPVDWIAQDEAICQNADQLANFEAIAKARWPQALRALKLLLKEQYCDCYGEDWGCKKKDTCLDVIADRIRRGNF